MLPKNWVRLRELYNEAYGRYSTVNKFSPLEWLHEEEQTEYCQLMIEEASKLNHGCEVTK
jgi:hypothetical protein